MNHRQSTDIPMAEQALRTVSLAQAIEQADTAQALVSAVERADALHQAVAQARQRGVPRPGLADVVLARAQAIVERARARDAVVAALQTPPWRKVGYLLCGAALLLGLAIDRIANAHRVDLLSPPLLIVLAWNLVVYLLIAWQAWRPQRSGTWLQQVLPQALRPLGRTGGQRGPRGLAARIAADFHTRWFAHAADLLQQRAARVLHLCAAAWGAGIALSLLLRGLVVRYQFGWESTFLDAAQVHAIVSVLFWPLTTLFGLAPFTLPEIAATQNFAGEGGAGVGGARWVWMYVGLLLLAVVLPRLALAAWARWREAQWQGRIDLASAAFDPLRASLPGDLVIGLHGPQAQVFHDLQTAQGDRLQFAHAEDAVGAAQPVDAVLAWAGTAPPPAWRAAPLVALRWQDFGASWVLEPVLFDRLDAALPAHRPAVARLRAAWVDRSAQHFGPSLQALARHLRACARLGPGDAPAQYAQQLQELDAALRALHGQPPAAPIPLPAQLPAPRRADGTALAVGTSAGAAAGAAAGAKAGALIDVGTGGLTLGAGTALGALLGGTTAWVLRGLQKKDEGRQDLLRHAAEAACTHYLVIAHQQRVPPAEAPQLAERWRAEVTGTVAAHADALAAALKKEAGDDSLQPLLRTMLMGILQRSFAAKI